MRILEQGASNLQGGGEGGAEAVGLLMLAMSTLLYRRYAAPLISVRSSNRNKFLTSYPDTAIVVDSAVCLGRLAFCH